MSDAKRMFVDYAEYGDGRFGVDLYYPERGESGISKTCVDVGLCDVRAADNIRVRYDFQRDGYVIYQMKGFEVIEGKDQHALSDLDDDGNDIWVEVAFIESWSQYEDVGPDDPRLERLYK